MKSLRFLLLAVLLAALPAWADVTADQAIGTPVTFSLTIAQGSPPFTFQWKKDAVAIPGATAATYRIAAVAAADAGTYTCVVTNKAGNASSDKGIFTITVNPGGVTISITQA